VEQDIDGGYLPTAEVPDLIGVERNVRELGKTMRREGLRPVRVWHAFWWHRDAVVAWAAARRWIRAQGSDPYPCSEAGCERDAVSHGLCLMHYKRARGPHADVVSRAGQPVGAGVYGRVEETPDGRLVCHECGGAYMSLAAHILRAHGMSAAEYREVYEIPRTTRLVASRIRERAGARASRSANLERLAAARDPQAAADARTTETFEAVSRAKRARDADR
jgi:hypothetical protein